MQNRSLSVILFSAPLLVACGPDLVVSNVQPDGPAVIGPGNSVRQPLTVVVANQGNEPAGAFKVSTQYSGGAIDPTRTFAVGFDVPAGPPFKYYPESTGLAVGASETFDGEVVFHPAEHGVTVALTAKVDSC